MPRREMAPEKRAWLVGFMMAGHEPRRTKLKSGGKGAVKFGWQSGRTYLLCTACKRTFEFGVNMGKYKCPPR